MAVHLTGRKKKKDGSSHENGSSHNSSHNSDRLSPEAFSRIARRPKFQRVMSEFRAGTLRSSSGALVTSSAQANAIAKSETQSTLRRARVRRS